ncbi:MAG TPA: MBL fold metallo-hydrolase [Propionibacteriaceae bacterium]|nr:MBL fold metallo-hydrolase [Micropruina sp.]HBY22249.1 MBL fold metallo-hydrolase [Propionibacteriaceae bacterium]
MTAVDLHLLVAGHSTQRELLARRGGSWRKVPFPATVALIVHATGPALYDTGYSSHYLDATTPFPERLYRWVIPGSITPRETASAQLADYGYAADQVGTIVLSHLHADHSSGLRDFPSARIIAGEASPTTPSERAHGRLVTTTRQGLLPATLPPDYATRRIAPTSLPLVDTGLPQIPLGYDVFGDHSVVIVPLPGHSPDHLGLWIPATQGPPVLLVGDACWSRAALTGSLPPRPVLASMHNPTAYVRTIEALSGLARSRPDILIVPSHCHESVTAAQAVLG